MNKLIEIIKPYFSHFMGDTPELIAKEIAEKITSSGLIRPDIEDILKEAPEIKKRLNAARMNSERDEAKELLKTYNRWRRGEEIECPSVTDIGKAIDKLTL